MRTFDVRRRACWLALLIALLPLSSRVQLVAQVSGVGVFPANGATNVNPDTHLVLTFPSPPAIGNSGTIRIYDAADNTLVDTLDMNIPPSPNPTGRAPAANGSTTAPTPPAALGPNQTDYQATQIGGTWFHFFPIIVRGNTATIYPHHNTLQYGRKYIVKMDAAVLKPASGAFAGFDTDPAWTFTTKAAPPPV